MKKSYESFGKVLVGFSCFLICVFITIIIFSNKKVVLYEVFNGVIFNENIVVLVLDNDEIKLFNKNKNLYIKNKKKKFEIIKIDKDILEREGKKYNQVYIKVNISNMYKVNDVVNISIMNKNVSSLKIFNIIWEGD